MRELGRKGGLKSPLTKLRRNADDDLREEARAVLARALRGEDVPKAALDSARSLFSYRSEAPPERQADGDYTGPLTPDGRRPTSLGDVLEFAMTANASTRAVAEAAIAQAQAATPAKGFSRNPAPSSTRMGQRRAQRT